MGLLGSAGHAGGSGLGTSLTSGDIFVGNASNVAAGVTPSGDATIDNTGVITIKSSVALAGSPTTTTQAASDSSTKIATTSYVTGAIATGVASVNSAFAADYASTANVAGTYNNGTAGVGATYTITATGVQTIDGQTVTLNDIVFWKDLTGGSGAYNGLYKCTVAGAIGVSSVFTRTTDYNTPSNINNTGAIEIKAGTANAGTSYLLTTKVATMGTDPLTYSIFTRKIADLLLAANNLSDLASVPTARTSLGLGTLATQSGTFSGTSSGTNTGDQTTVSGNAGTATALATARAIYGNNFDGTAAITAVIASTYGGTGNGFAKLSGPASTEKTFTLPNASDTIACIGTAQTWTAAQTFTNSDIKLLGSSTGATTFTSANASATNYTLTLPAVTDTVAGITLQQSSKSAAYTTVLADAGTEIYHPSTDNNARTFTIDSNANVAYAIGTLITFTNAAAASLSIAITTDTMTLAGSTTTGTRTLSQNGTATAAKKTSTTWIISGVGLT